MAQIYSLDTSALIDGIERFYPIRNFPQFWEKMDELIVAGRLKVSEEVWAEAQRIDAPLRDWCQDKSFDRTACISPTTLEVANAAGSIMTMFPQWSTQGKKNGADPFVIAVAMSEGGQVISGETNGGPAKPKIPYVCTKVGVAHGRLVDLIRGEDWIIG